MNITVSINDRQAVYTGGGPLPCGEEGHTVTFTFSAVWSIAGTKTARFSFLQKDGWHYRDAAFTGTTATVPTLPAVDSVYIGVFEGAWQTTAPACVPCAAAEDAGSGTVGTAGEGYYMPQVQADGDLVWQPSNDSLPDVPTVNVMGPAGPQGDTGRSGPAGAAGPQGAQGFGLFPCGMAVPTVTAATANVGIFAFHLPDGYTLRAGDCAVGANGYLARVSAVSGTSVPLTGTGISLKS